MESLIDDRALIDDEEDDESFDEETGEVRQKANGANNHFDDSSEEDEDDDDEEAAAEVAKGFIVDEDEEDDEAREERRRERKKRRREEREREDEGLDEEDLELIGVKPAEESTEPKFKRLKRGPREDRDGQAPAGLDDMFRDEEEGEDDGADYARRQNRMDRRGGQDEFDDFIEEDVFSDDEQQRQREDEEVARPTRRGIPDLGMADAAGLDEQALEDFRAAFGDGTDYDFALEKEEEAEEEEANRDKNLDLKDVFEPSQLKEKMLTEEDNIIRITDEPERHQIARKPYRHILLSDDDVREEAGWIAELMLPKRPLASDLHEPFRRAVAQVLDFLVREDYEVPFIFQNRKDYLIHAADRVVGRKEDGTVQTEKDAKKLLHQNDLWEIFDFDLKFRAFIEKRQALQSTYDKLKESSVPADNVFELMLPKAVTMEELQDMQDYLYFQYASQLKDIALTTTNGDANGVGMSRKKASTQTVFEEIRNGKAYSVVRAFGISADAFAQNAMKEGVRTYAEDPTESPSDLADSMIDEEFQTGSKVLKAAKSMFVEELVTNPRLRNLVRKNVYSTGVIDCFRTEKGLRKIDDLHPYYAFKYLRNQDFGAIARQPEVYLRMLKAEEEGLIEVNVRLQNLDSLKKQSYKHIETDNYSTVADAWNQERREVVSAAIEKIISIMGKAVKENLRNACEATLLADCREELTRQLDQAPYTPKGMKKGTIPRVLTLSNGAGVPGRDATCWAYVAEDGRVLENGNFTELAPGDRERGLPDGKDVAAFVDLVQRREPDVIAISGFSPETRKLKDHLTTLVLEKDLRGAIYQDSDDDRDVSDLLEVVIVHDEIARLYQSSERAKLDHPSFAPLTHYCVALAKYLQDPLKEYAALGKDVSSLSFHPAQNLLPQEKVSKTLETVLVDFVNMVGIDLNEAVSDEALAALLPYVAGLGPRKATHLRKVINLNGGIVNTREELLGVGQTYAAFGVKVWNNCVGSLFLEYDPSTPESEYLDNTRIHPEDYDIARKMAADALELDEEDIKVETDEYGSGAIIRKLIKDDAQDRVNDLVLEEYAEQLERNLNQRKRATLENIRAEIIEPYEELRQPFMTTLSSEQIFTMFTGETRYSLEKGMNVPMSIKKVTDMSVEGRLDCGVEAFVLQNEISDRYDVSPKQLFSMHQTVQGHIMSLDRKNLTATISLRDEYTKRPYKKYHRDDRNYDEWDDRAEAADRKLLEEKGEIGGRAARVIKHPLFRPFNSKQAEEYLGSQNRGDVVIRPSSKGTDHLAVTWKVSDGLYQHLDVLELDKENEFALGKTLRIGGRYTYSDLDELIVLHVKAMARKVDEMTGHEKFMDKTKASTDEWLTTYANANTKRSMYMFCFNRERPGVFWLCFKPGQKARLQAWEVRVLPSGYELMKNPYPTMKDLCNGFKLLFSNMQNASLAVRPPRR